MTGSTSIKRIIDTDREEHGVPRCRYGHVEDVAALVAFVAGPQAAYITGASLTVDGGTNA
jgi:NAD(P)-dependent dehydrogenase (short-subunit alcohol dehydrogenase family)